MENYSSSTVLHDDDSDIVIAFRNAVQGGNVDEVRTILETTPNHTTTLFSGDHQNNQLTPLHLAAERGHTEVLRLLLGAGANVSSCDAQQSIPLHLAAYNGHVAAIQLLLSRSTLVDVSSTDCQQMTSLHLAVFNGHLDAVRVLLSAPGGVDCISRCDIQQSTPVHIAARKKHVAILSELLICANPASLSGLNALRCTPLHYAVQNNDSHSTKALLDAGADPSVKGDKQWAPLHFAALKGNVEIAQLLLEAGAEVSSLNQNNSIPLNTAAFKGHLEMVKLLITAGSDLSCQNDAGSTPVHFATQRCQIPVLLALIEAGADASTANARQNAPLHTAARLGHVEALKVLLHAGANGDMVMHNEEGHTPLHLAAMNKGSVDTIQTLFGAGADLFSRDNRGFTPFLIAVQHGHREVVQALINAGSDLSSRVEEGWTCLHLAAQNGDATIVNVLLDANADCFAETEASWWPIDIAAMHGHADVVKQLLSAADQRQPSPLPPPNANDANLPPPSLHRHPHRSPAIDWAITRNQAAVLQVIADHAPQQLVVPNPEGWIPLQVAIYHHNRHHIDILLEAMTTHHILGTSRIEDGWNSKSMAIILDRSDEMISRIEAVEADPSRAFVDSWLAQSRCDEYLGAAVVASAEEASTSALGSCGFGFVQGVTLSSGERFALKHDNDGGSGMNVAFETAVMKSLDHENIVKVFGHVSPKDSLVGSVAGDRLQGSDLESGWVATATAGSSEQSPSTSENRASVVRKKNKKEPARCMVMEWMNCGSLIDWVKWFYSEGKGHLINERVVRLLMKQALTAIIYLHIPIHTDPFGRKNMSIVHHDIKPHNMLIHVREDGRYLLKLADFGLARYDRYHSITQRSSVGGTKSYLGPEAGGAQTNKQYTPASDIYSWAKSFVEVAACHSFTFNEPTPDAIEKVMAYTTLTPQAKDLLRQCLDRNPEKRPTAAQLLQSEYFESDEAFYTWFQEAAQEVAAAAASAGGHPSPSAEVASLNDIAIHFSDVSSSNNNNSNSVKNVVDANRTRMYEFQVGNVGSDAEEDYTSTASATTQQQQQQQFSSFGSQVAIESNDIRGSNNDRCIFSSNASSRVSEDTTSSSFDRFASFKSGQSV